MDLQYSGPEMFLMYILIPLIACTIIALLNMDWLNALVVRIYEWIEARYNAATRRFWRAFWGILRFPKVLTTAVPHEGWKSGLTVGLGGFSVMVLIGVLYITVWAIIIIVGLFFVLSAAAAGASNPDNRRYYDDNYRY